MHKNTAKSAFADGIRMHISGASIKKILFFFFFVENLPRGRNSLFCCFGWNHSNNELLPTLLLAHFLSVSSLRILNYFLNEIIIRLFELESNLTLHSWTHPRARRSTLLPRATLITLLKYSWDEAFAFCCFLSCLVSMPLGLLTALPEITTAVK